MRRLRITCALVMGAALAGALFMVGCSSKDDNPAGPMGGGPTWSSGVLPTGGSYQRTFTEVGSWNYRCTIHSGMTGVVNVDPGAANPESVVVSIATPMRFNLANVTVKTGGYVRWVNQDGANHTATR